MRRVFLVACLFLTPRWASAQGLADAEVLPKGVGALLIQPGISYGGGSLERFGRGWQTRRESFITDFNGIDLSEVIAGDRGKEITDVIGDFGTTGFEGNLKSVGFNFIAAFGVTDRLTILGLLPYQYASYSLDAYLTPTGNPSHYRVKNSELITCPGGNFNLNDPDQILNELLEYQNEDYVFNIGDLNRALQSPCLGYKPVIDRTELRNGVIHGIGDRTYSGFRDLGVAAKYQFWHGRNLHLAGLTYLVLPTGTPDDPDDLFDPAFGDGQTDWAFLAAATIPLNDFTIGVSAGYEISFGDSIERRIGSITFDDELETQLANQQISERDLLDDHLDDATLIPIVTSFDKAEVKRKLGDNVYVYSQFNYQILEWLSVGITINFLHHFRDSVSEIGARPDNAAPYPTEDAARAAVAADIAARDLRGEFRDEATREATRLSDLRAALGNTVERRKAAFGWHTVRGSLVGGFGIGFNTLGMFLRDEFPLPIIASISISRNLAGQNLDTPDSIQMTIVLPFALGDVLDPSTVAFDGEEGEGLPYP